jgi:hypothetical protein
MAAITSTLLTLLKAGDHMLIQRAAYGGTYDLVHHQLKDLGIGASMIDISAAADSWKPLLQPNTKVGRSLRINGHVMEAISNPLMEAPFKALVITPCYHATQPSCTCIIPAAVVGEVCGLCGKFTMQGVLLWLLLLLLLLLLQVIYVEAISNPLMEVPDLPAVVAFARQHKLTSVIDATFATPINLQPALNPGFNVVIHSATKFLNGHSDLIAGVVAGSADIVNQVRLSRVVVVVVVVMCSCCVHVCQHVVLAVHDYLSSTKLLRLGYLKRCHLSNKCSNLATNMHGLRAVQIKLRPATAPSCCTTSSQQV